MTVVRLRDAFVIVDVSVVRDLTATPTLRAEILNTSRIRFRGNPWCVAGSEQIPERLFLRHAGSCVQIFRLRVTVAGYAARLGAKVNMRWRPFNLLYPMTLPQPTLAPSSVSQLAAYRPGVPLDIRLRRLAILGDEGARPKP